MKRIININLSGRVIPIEDSAYESLQQYIGSLRSYFAGEEGRDEIINDIESRIAELMSEKIKKGAAAVTDADIQEIIATMGRIEDFEETERMNEESANTGTYNSKGFPGNKRFSGRLYRNESDKLVGGVCAGIANYVNVDPAVVRLLFAIVTFGGFGAGIFLYILLWIVLPARSLEAYLGKRLYRNPEEKVFSGVAGGLAAYFNKPVWAVRLIFAAPLLLNILSGILNGISNGHHFFLFPNLVVGSFTGTFILAYIVLWIVLPEARSPLQKMEMRGEKVDVASIRQNVRDELENLKTSTRKWAGEVEEKAREFGGRARTFANTRGKAFANEMSDLTQPATSGLAHAIGVLFKAFFIFIVGCIFLSIFAVLIALAFSGFSFKPVNGFLWSSPWQQTLAWLTLVFFLIVPVVAVLVWLIRRITGTRPRNRYLGWTFGGMWTLGWIFATLLVASISRDLSNYETVDTDIAVTQPAGGKLVVKVNEAPIRYRENGFWWVDSDMEGFDINEDTMRYSNVRINVEKSEDASYHVVLHRHSAGSSIKNAEERATQTEFRIAAVDSLLNLGSGVAIGRKSKFRGQGVTVEILVPVGKQIRFDETLDGVYDPFTIRRTETHRRWRNWSRYNYRVNWNEDRIGWDLNKDYVMTTTGLEEKGKEKQTEDNLEELKRQNEEQQQRIKELEESRKRDSLNKKPVAEADNDTRPMALLTPASLFILMG